MLLCTGYGVRSAADRLAPLDFQRRDPGPDDVEIEILYCGVCHSDLHQVRNEWHNTIYPCVPGHEIIGRVTRVGDRVEAFTVGQIAGVGCMVDSCRECEACKAGEENYCKPGFTGTYNSPDEYTGTSTFGGYSSHVVVDKAFVLRIPENLELAGVAPLLCAGITTYSPLRHWGVKAGHKVGIVGLGGLGHMGVKLAHAMGAKVTLFTTSPSKEEDARRLGADDVVISTDKDAMARHGESLDFILDTVAASNDVNEFLGLLKRDGTLVRVGASEKPLPVNLFSVIQRRRSFAGSFIGGISETQEMLDFCAEHGITADIEIINMADIETAFQRMLKGDVKYRFVIDMATLKQAA